MIRDFLQTDLEAVMALWLTANEEAHPFIAKKYWRENYSLVEELLPQATLYVYPAANGGIAGFIGLQGDYIAGLFVAKNHRSQGIGKQLLDFAKTKQDTLQLKVYQANEKATAFYLREGFQLEKVTMDEATQQPELLLRFNQTGTVENFQ